MVILKLGVPFEVLGLPEEGEGYEYIGLSEFPDYSEIKVTAYDADTNNLEVQVLTPVNQFFRLYLPEGTSTYSVSINGGSPTLLNLDDDVVGYIVRTLGSYVPQPDPPSQPPPDPPPPSQDGHGLSTTGREK